MSRRPSTCWQRCAEGSDQAVCQKIVDLLKKGISPQSIWDAILTGSTELLMRRPGIVSLHSVTSSNALRYAYEQSGNDETRRWLLLQNAAFVTLFRKELLQREKLDRLPGIAIDKLEAVSPKASGKDAIAEIFGELNKNRENAAQKVLGYLKGHGQPKELIDAARLLIFLKGNDTHDYKFSSAVLEDYYHVSPAWRDRFLAASVFHLRGSSEPDNRLVQRTRAALKA